MSRKNQIVVPSEARKTLGIKPGDELLVVVRGNHFIVRRRPKDYEKALRGMARGLYPSDHVGRERASWE